MILSIQPFESTEGIFEGDAALVDVTKISNSFPHSLVAPHIGLSDVKNGLRAAHDGKRLAFAYARDEATGTFPEFFKSDDGVFCSHA